MENLSNLSISLNQWFLMFIFAMGVLVLCSLISMFSIWIISSKLSEIHNKLDELTHKKDIAG